MLEKVNKLRDRPRVFDMDEALDKALYIFWKRGYEGTSLAELIDALRYKQTNFVCSFW